MSDAAAKRSEVSEYYGTTLATSDDLKTNACCSAEVPQYVKDVLKTLHPEVIAKYYGCGLCVPDCLGGLSVLEYIYASHASGAQAAADYVTAWQSLRGLIDEGAYGTGVFDTVEGRLKFGASEAKRFSSIIVDYFANLTHVPPAEGNR